MQKDQLLKDFIEEAASNVDTVEVGLLQLEKGNLDADTIHNIFRAVHSIKGAAGFFGLKNIVNISHVAENILGEIRNGNMTITNEIIDILLSANDTLKAMVIDVENSENVDISAHMAKLLSIMGGSSVDQVTEVKQDHQSTSPIKEKRKDKNKEVCLPVKKAVMYDKVIVQNVTVPSVVKDLAQDYPILGSHSARGIKDKLLTFYLCGSYFGIDIRAVKEINRNIEYTPVPDAPSHIIGLMNMRGQIVTLFNLAGLMGYKQGNEKHSSTCIILKNKPSDPDFVGFLIERSGSVIDVDNDACEPPPANIDSAENKIISQVVKLKDELLMVINQEVIFEQ